MERNNNNAEINEANMNSKKHNLERPNSTSVSSTNKSKKKKKLGLFSFRSKKSSKTISNVGEQSDTISVCSEVSITEEYVSTVETSDAAKQISSEENHLESLRENNPITNTMDEKKNNAVDNRTPRKSAQLAGDVDEAQSNSEEVTSNTVTNTMEDGCSLTLVTPLSEENHSVATKFEQRTESEHLIVQQIEDSNDNNLVVTSIAVQQEHSSDVISNKSVDSSPRKLLDIPGRPDSILLKTDNLNSSVDNLSVRRQRIFADHHSSSTEYSSYPVTPVRKWKSKKAKMLNNSEATHQLTVRLLSGEKLAVRDTNGLSDPYVKFKIGRRTLYKSKTCKATLNPLWGEEFTKPINSADKLSIFVYDYDLGRRDDFMGSAVVDLDNITENEEIELSVSLEEADSDEDLGFIHIAVTMVPLLDEVDSGWNGTDSRPSPEDFGDNVSIASSRILNERYSFSRSDSNASDISRRTAMSMSTTTDVRNRKMLKVNVATATVQLVSGTGLPARDSNGLSDPYVKLHMGKQRHKSKVCYKTLDPVWKEEFLFQLTGRESLDRDTACLDVTVWDRDSYRKDDFIGRCEVDLWSLEYDKTHKISLNLIDAPGSIMLLITLHTCKPSDVPVNSSQLNQLREKYSIPSTFSTLSDVGFAEVKMIRANGCRAADIGGKSDPFCVVELCNARAQTHTCYKTLDPVWNKTVTFPIKDIHDVLKFTVYDEDKDGVNDFLGRLSIPLLRVQNGEERIYALKDRKLMNKSKGTVTLQIRLIYNQVRAAIRTFTPREPDLMKQDPRFKRQLLLRNFHRVWNCVQAVLQTLEFVNSCFTWQNPVRSLTAFIVYLLLVWNVELYMLPILLLLLLLKNYFAIVVKKSKVDRRVRVNTDESYDDEDDDVEDQDSSGRLTFIQRLNAIQEVLVKVQNVLDWIACLLERIHNTFTWSVPFLSTLAVIVLSVLCIILYFIPFRTIAILWGINKFTKRLRKPNFIPNNELLDFLSRIPSEVELDEYQELSSMQGSPKNSKKKK